MIKMRTFGRRVSVVIWDWKQDYIDKGVKKPGGDGAVDISRIMKLLGQALMNPLPKFWLYPDWET